MEIDGTIAERVALDLQEPFQKWRSIDTLTEGIKIAKQPVLARTRPLTHAEQKLRKASRPCAVVPYLCMKKKCTPCVMNVVPPANTL